MSLTIESSDPLNEVKSPQAYSSGHPDVFGPNDKIPPHFDFPHYHNYSGSYKGTTGQRIGDLCEKWLNNFAPWHRDAARVSKFYSGVVTESNQTRKVMGLIDHANYMPGRTAIATARDEAFNYFTQPRRLGNLKLKEFDGTPNQKSCQEEKASKIIDRHLRRKSSKFLSEVEDMCDRHSVHGDSVMMFPPEGEGHVPFQAEILTDTDAPQDLHDDNFRRWAVMDDLQVSEVLQGIRNGDEGWTTGVKKALEFFWKHERESIDPDYAEGEDPEHLINMVSCMTAEEIESNAQANNEICDFVNTRLRVFYFYQKDFSDPSNGIPVDYYVVARFHHYDLDYHSDESVPDSLLYEKKAAFRSVKRCGVDFVLDTNLGVKDNNWGSIKGLAHLNYVPDSMMNILISSMQNSAIDKNTPLWQIGDIGDQKLFEDWIKKGYKAHSIMPTGLDLVDKQKIGGNVAETAQMIGLLQSLSNQQAISQTRDSNPTHPNELRLERISRTERDNRVSSNRGVSFSLRIDFLIQEMYRRIFEEIHEYSTLSEFSTSISSLHADLLAEGVEVEWFYSENVEVSYARLLGDGDPQARQEAISQILGNLQLIPEEQRTNELREWYASLKGWDAAEEVYSEETNDGLNSDQVATAMTKFGTMMQIGQPLPVGVNDVPEIQVPVILSAARQFISQIVSAGEMTLRDANGFTAAGAHVMMMIDKLDELGRQDVAQIFRTELQSIATEFQEPFNNFLQTQQQGGELTVEDQLRINKDQREERKQNLEEQRFIEKIQKDDRAEGRKEREFALKQFNSSKDNLRKKESNEIYSAQVRLQNIVQGLKSS